MAQRDATCCKRSLTVFRSQVVEADANETAVARPEFSNLAEPGPWAVGVYQKCHRGATTPQPFGRDPYVRSVKLEQLRLQGQVGLRHLGAERSRQRPVRYHSVGRRVRRARAAPESVAQECRRTRCRTRVEPSAEPHAAVLAAESERKIRVQLAQDPQG